ncbi:MAG: 5-carboxymethyl-2-hydroxymuconate semialdehyde dehydrogenase [Actinomycetota bacterium]
MSSVFKQPLLYIDGEYRSGVDGATFETLNPATNNVITEVAEGRERDVDAAVRAARTAFDEGPWPRMSPKERAAYLIAIAEAVEGRGAEIAELEVMDTGLPIKQAKGQAARAAQNFRFFARVIEDLGGEAHRVGGEFLNYTIHKPVGVAGLITPWNTPFMLESWKIAPCLASGCTAVLKPAEWSPLTAMKFAEIMDEVELPRGVLNIVHGFGETAGAPLVAHPGVDLISFTGETTTGKHIMRNGAETLKRYSLELGGKSPVVVFADADLERAVDAAVFGVFSLNGERCTAGSRLLVEDDIYDDFIAAVGERTARIRVGDPTDMNTELGPLIHPEHLQRVTGYIDLGVQQGARLVAGGERPPGLEGGNYLQATAFADVTPDMRIFREEIFGPVVVATRFSTEAEAVELANDVRYGLAGYVWTGDVQKGHRVAQAIDTGMVWINSQNVRDLRMPFGGVKDSGIGREGGHYSFEFYCELETIHVALGEHHIPKFGITE